MRFFLDGFAHVLEAQVGRFLGAKDQHRLRLVSLRSSVLAGGCALLLALSFYYLGAYVAQLLTNKQDVVDLVVYFLPYCALYTFLAVAAFQLDGLYIGVSYGAAMRNCSMVSTLIFLFSWYFFFIEWGNTGLWLAFIVFVVIRGASLAFYLPALKRYVQLQEKPRHV